MLLEGDRKVIGTGRNQTDAVEISAPELIQIV
jgi:hypothetical protein